MRRNQPLRMILMASFALAAMPANAADITIGLQSDPNMLDPAQSAAVTERVVLAAMCDKLIDVTPDGGLRPQLATDWSWSDDNLTLNLTLRDGVTFQDGTTMDAAAVKANLDRYRTDELSRRKNELASIAEVEVVNPSTVRLHLSEPYAPLLAALADRSGMMLSPRTLEQGGDAVAVGPVCAGPFSLANRVAQDHVTLESYDGYWNADAIHLDTVTYRIIPDESVRLLSLRSGDLDLIERVSPSDMATIESDPELKLIQAPSIAYDMITFNIDNGPMGDTPLGNSKLVRKALELSLDREAINQVLYDGLFIPGNQHELNGTTYWNEDKPQPGRDVERARELLAEAGVENPSFTLMVSNTPRTVQLGSIIQSMAAEAGFDIEVRALTPATWVSYAEAGEFEANISIWSGRPDPDANVSPWTACEGFLNARGRWCNEDYDKLLTEARQTTDVEARKALYDRIVDIYLDELPQIVLYHYQSLWAARTAVEGFTPYADGLIRLQDVRIVEP